MSVKCLLCLKVAILARDYENGNVLTLVRDDNTLPTIVFDGRSIDDLLSELLARHIDLDFRWVYPKASTVILSEDIKDMVMAGFWGQIPIDTPLKGAKWACFADTRKLSLDERVTIDRGIAFI